MPRWLHVGVAARYLLHEAFNISLQNEREGERGRERERERVKLHKTNRTRSTCRKSVQNNQDTRFCDNRARDEKKRSRFGRRIVNVKFKRKIVALYKKKRKKD